MKPIEETAFEMAQSQLLNQNDELRNYRNQASFCAAILGLIGTVFAGLIDGRSLSDAHFPPFFLGVSLEIFLVLLTFICGIACSVRVITGWKSCTFHLNPMYLLENKDLKPAEDLLVEMTKFAYDFFEENEIVLKDARSMLLFGLVFGILNLGSWSYLFVRIY